MIKCRRQGSLIEREEKFCLEYLIDFNPERAALGAGYKASEALFMGYLLKDTPRIKKRIHELQMQEPEKYPWLVESSPWLVNGRAVSAEEWEKAAPETRNE
jgi:hypothetical protein